MRVWMVVPKWDWGVHAVFDNEEAAIAFQSRYPIDTLIVDDIVRSIAFEGD